MKNINPDFPLARLPLWKRGIEGDFHLRATRIHTAIRITLAGLLLAAATGINAEELGRLFFTPEQRALFERGQQPDAGKPENVGSLTVDGIVQKHGGERTVWINGVPQPAGRSDEHAPESVPVAIPGQSQPARVKVGQKVIIGPAAVPEK